MEVSFDREILFPEASMQKKHLRCVEAELKAGGAILANPQEVQIENQAIQLTLEGTQNGRAAGQIRLKGS